MSRPINPNIRYAKDEPFFEVTSQQMIAEALREFSRDELRQMPRPMVLTIFSMLEKAMKRRGTGLKKEELEGIREIVTEHIYGQWWVDLYWKRNQSQGDV